MCGVRKALQNAMEVDEQPDTALLQPPMSAAPADPSLEDACTATDAMDSQPQQDQRRQQPLEGAVPPAAPPEPDPDPRKAWVLQMRRAFSPPGMLLPDGGVNQDFFRPRRVVLVQDRRWGDAERELLTQGLEKFGVGRCAPGAAQELLPGSPRSRTHARHEPHPRT